MAMDILAFIIGCCALLATVAAAVIILHPKIHEGLLIKIGLITLAFGGVAIVAHVPGLRPDIELDVLPLLRGMTLYAVGMLIAGAGVAWRVWRHPEGRRAALIASGWTPLDDQPSAE